MSLEEELRSIVGAANLFAGGDIEERYTADITHKYHSQPGFVVRPADTAQIVGIVKLAGRRGVPITPLAVAPAWSAAAWRATAASFCRWSA